METPTILEIGKHILNYSLGLDWTFIISFILLAYGAIHVKEKENLKIETRYLVALVGLVYSVILFFIRNYNLQQVDALFQSFIFALVFHKLLIDKVLGYARDVLFPKAEKNN